MAPRDPDPRRRHSLADVWASAPPGAARLPRIHAMGCNRPLVEEVRRRRNDHHLLMLVTEAPAWVQHGDHALEVRPGTLVLTRRGELHGLACHGAKPPLTWELYFIADPDSEQQLGVLAHDDPHRRVLLLSERQQQAFHSQFVTLFLELHLAHKGCEQAASALLSVLLVTIERWTLEPSDSVPPVAPAHADGDVLDLWRRLHLEAITPGGSPEALRSRIPHYDALRHRFRRAFGESPRQTWIRLRMREAKRLLVESKLSVGEIADRVGYARQHEFTRAFHREVGVTPTWWRERSGDPREDPS